MAHRLADLGSRDGAEPARLAIRDSDGRESRYVSGANAEVTPGKAPRKSWGEVQLSLPPPRRQPELDHIQGCTGGESKEHRLVPNA